MLLLAWQGLVGLRSEAEAAVWLAMYVCVLDENEKEQLAMSGSVALPVIAVPFVIGGIIGLLLDAQNPRSSYHSDVRADHMAALMMFSALHDNPPHHGPPDQQ